MFKLILTSSSSGPLGDENVYGEMRVVALKFPEQHESRDSYSISESRNETNISKEQTELNPYLERSKRKARGCRNPPVSRSSPLNRHP